MKHEIAILVMILLAILITGAAIGSCAMDAHAGNQRILVALAPCWVPSCPTPPGWREAGSDGDGRWGYGRRDANGQMRWVRSTP